jgi:hypothetical protein
MTDDKLLRAAAAAYHLCESLLAYREGATDELITEIRDALKVAIADTTTAPAIAAPDR